MKVRAALVTALAAAAISAATATAAGTQVASCDPGPVMIGSGSPDWRREGLAAGPLGIRKRPLRSMSAYSPRRPNQLVTKAPVLIEGHQPVTLRVPPRLTHRVFLYYGFHRGRDGRRSTSFTDFPGNSAIEFRPCTDKPRTIWPGGLRVKGRKPVRLLVEISGRSRPLRLRLGRPTRLRP